MQITPKDLVEIIQVLSGTGVNYGGENYMTYSLARLARLEDNMEEIKAMLAKPKKKPQKQARKAGHK